MQPQSADDCRLAHHLQINGLRENKLMISNLLEAGFWTGITSGLLVIRDLVAAFRNSSRSPFANGKTEGLSKNFSHARSWAGMAAFVTIFALTPRPHPRDLLNTTTVAPTLRFLNHRAPH